MDKSRQQFEEKMAEYLSLDINEITSHREDDKYHSLTVSVAWFWWQASRESLEVELPYKFQPSFYSYEDVVNTGFDVCADILISNGVKIKNE